MRIWRKITRPETQPLDQAQDIRPGINPESHCRSTAWQDLLTCVNSDEGMDNAFDLKDDYVWNLDDLKSGARLSTFVGCQPCTAAESVVCLGEVESWDGRKMALACHRADINQRHRLTIGQQLMTSTHPRRFKVASEPYVAEEVIGPTF